MEKTWNEQQAQQIEKYPVKSGDRFRTFRQDWVVLDTEYPVSAACNYVLANSGETGVLAITERLICRDIPFAPEGYGNNWKNSHVRHILERWMDHYICCQDILWGRLADLTDSMGYGTYGLFRCRVSSLTLGEYVRYREYIPDYGQSWWTMTPQMAVREFQHFENMNRCVEVVHSGGDTGSCMLPGGNKGVPAVCLFRREFAETMAAIQRR